ncbi:MAG: aminotransferase class III-fold pyridoxal phosphate-dependent enzyme [Caldisericia bacterium]|nr:aminotransferase class III-fold pyridoxal phosphate-dependent enzyme [Caldisericia bacterium]
MKPTQSLYPYFPLQVRKTKGIWIYGADGKKYLDTFSGIGVSLLGHQHPGILRAMRKKMRTCLHLSNFFQDSDLDDCVSQLSELSGLHGQVLFTNSGAEANEWALKIVKKTFSGQPLKILHFDGSFHGRTTGTLSINGHPEQRSPFEPLLADTVLLPWNDLNSLDNWMEKHGQATGALFLEFIQGTGGVRVLSEEMAQRIRFWQSKFHFYMVADEIQTGLGRTGSVFAFQQYGLIPDILTLGKGLGGGLPLGAVVVNPSLSSSIKPCDHGSTMAPNPIALAGCKVVLSTIPALAEQVSQRQETVRLWLDTELHHVAREIRGKGYMIGIDMGTPLPALVKKAYEQHQLLLNIVQGQVIRLLPPLNISMKDWQRIILTLRKTLGGAS